VSVPVRLQATAGRQADRVEAERSASRPRRCGEVDATRRSASSCCRHPRDARRSERRESWLERARHRRRRAGEPDRLPPRARWLRWHLPPRPLPDAPFSAAPADASIPGLFSTDESVATSRRFQRTIARSSHGLCSPSRFAPTSDGDRLSPGTDRAPASWRRSIRSAARRGESRRCGPALIPPEVSLRRFVARAVHVALQREEPVPARAPFQRRAGVPARAPGCRPPKRRRAREQYLWSLSGCRIRGVRFP
jgi:hypothetical protein